MVAKTPKKKTGVHVNLMLAEDLHAKVLERAQRRQSTVNNMVRVMIQDCLQREEISDLEDIKKELGDVTSDIETHWDLISTDLRTISDDMEITWSRFSAQFMRLELEEKIVDELAKAQCPDDIARIRNLAQTSQKIRAAQERQERKALRSNKEEGSS